jgi:DNA-binding transcriptional ArsR family regulator
MDPDADLAAVASLIADRHRAQLLQALLSGKPQTGLALAASLGISRSLASAHLRKLVDGGLVRAQRDGRQKLYSIAAEPVADALEILTLLAPPSPQPVRSLRDATRTRSLRWARMCYDHLAGVVGVAVTEALLAQGALRDADGGWGLGPDGPGTFARAGITAGDLPRRGRPLVRPCMDWSERRHHLAGSLGAALAGSLVQRDWIRRREGTRIVTVTPAGMTGLREWLGVDLDQLRARAA